MRTNSTPRIVCAAVLGLCLFAAGQFAVASGINTNNPNLPPDGVYLTPDQVHAMYSGPGLAVVLSQVQHKPFAAQSTRHTSGSDEIEDFQSGMNGNVSVNGSPPQPANGTGPVQVISFGKAGQVTGTFNTEMLQLNISGVSPFGPFMIRESPTLASTGQTKITDIGGGMFHIDSFFDVFTELSVDGGNTWIPSSGAAHVILVPEPSSVILCGLGLVGMGLAIRNRRRQA